MDDEKPVMRRCAIGYGIKVEYNKETNMLDITVDPSPIIPETEGSPGRDGPALREFMQQTIEAWRENLEGGDLEAKASAPAAMLTELTGIPHSAETQTFATKGKGAAVSDMAYIPRLKA